MSKEELDQGTNRYTTKTYLSFSMWLVMYTMLTQTMGLFLYFYYHTVIGLSPLLIFTATAINTVWGGFNDPFIGYLTDRNFKWTRKWGRRFPFMALGLIPWCFIVILIFSAPAVTADPMPAFIWLLVMLILNELFMTISDVHGNMLRADKFRTEAERRQFSGYFGIFGLIAAALGTALPPLLLFFGDTPLSYMVMAIIISMSALVGVFLFLLNGAREDKIMIDRYYSGDYKRFKLLNGAKEVLKQKSFIGFWLAAAGHSIAYTMTTALVAYIATFVLQVPTFIMTILLAIFIVGGIISVPIWLKILKKVNDARRVYLIGSIAFIIALIPLTFFTGVIDLAIFMFITGLTFGCLLSLKMPVIFSHVQDDFVVRTGKNQKGILVGTWAILTLFTSFVDELMFTLVFTITGFKEGYATYALLEAEVGASAMIPIVWGVRLLFGVIPMIIMGLGTLAFWKLYALNHEKVVANKAKLKELGF